jgi:hypothetical protein
MTTSEPPADADFLVYQHGANVVVEPRNPKAKECFSANAGDEVLGWFNGAPIVEKSAVVPVTHKLITAGFNVIGERALIEAGPRLYVCDGKWWLYTGGRAIRPKLISQILKGAGAPN